jgi:hypothetical protein
MIFTHVLNRGGSDRRARLMHSERAQIVCSPNGISLITDAVFAGQSRAVEKLDRSLERRENHRTHERR